MVSKTFAYGAQWKLGASPVISYLGSYWNVEGVAVLLHSAKLLVDYGVEFKMTLSGFCPVGKDCDDVGSLIRELGLQEHVIETGWLGMDDVIDAMSAADILVVPKLDHLANVAGVATKLAEYLSIGKAVVASRVGDTLLYLQDHIDSLVCEPGNPTLLANALQQLLLDAPLRARLGMNARQTAFKFFDYRSAGLVLERALGAFCAAQA